MKTTKTLSRLAILLMALVLLLSLAACNPSDMLEENAEVREMTEDMLDAIIAGDKNAAYALFPSLTQTEFDSFFPAARQYFDGVESYTLTMTGVKVNVKNGVTQYTVVYHMETNIQPYEITASTASNVEGFYGFHVVSEEDSTVRYTGTFTTMKGANIAQWVLLIVGLATYAFLIAVLVDCCRQKIKRKWLFILMIIFGSVAFLFTVQNSGVNFNFNFLNLLSYTALMIYQNPPDAVQLRIFVPVGAIVYLCLRKKLIAKAQEIPVPPMPLVYDESMNGGFMYTPAEAPVEPVVEVTSDMATEVPAEGQGSDENATMETVEQPADAPGKKEET